MRVPRDAVQPRLAPLPGVLWGDDILDALKEGKGSLLAEELKEALGDEDLPRLAAILPNAITTMLHHPRLAGRFLAFNGVFLSDAALPPRWRELLVLRVAWRTRSTYEWLQHVRTAPRYGITIDEITAIAEGSDPGTWEGPEADLVAAADQLFDRYCVEEETWSRLAAHLDERQLLEVPFVAGSYACQAMVYNTLQIQPDASLLTVNPPAMP